MYSTASMSPSGRCRASGRAERHHIARSPQAVAVTALDRRTTHTPRIRRRSQTATGHDSQRGLSKICLPDAIVVREFVGAAGDRYAACFEDIAAIRIAQRKVRVLLDE